jgi:hypothetical protein
MSGGTFVRGLAMLALVAVLVAVGVGVYNAGVTAGVAQQGAAIASGAPVVVYPGPYIGHGWGWGPGFGFFGIFFWILGIFLIFGLIRAAFGFGNHGGRRGWGGHHGGYAGYAGHGGDPRDHLEDWHRRAHETGDGGSTPQS